MKLGEFKNKISERNPVQLYLNGKLVWDDMSEGFGSLEDYDKVFKENYNSEIESIEFEDVHIHHTIVYIQTFTDGIGDKND